MDLVEVLNSMYFTAKDIVRYGCENAGICDLVEEVSERLDLPTDDVVDPKSDDMRIMVDAEMQTIEDDVREACVKIMDELDRLDPRENFNEFVDGLDEKQKRKLSEELAELDIDGAHPVDMKEAGTYVKMVVAYYALYMDGDPLERLSIAIDNFLEYDKDEDDDMDESIRRRRIRRIIENKRRRRNF